MSKLSRLYVLVLCLIFLSPVIANAGGTKFINVLGKITVNDPNFINNKRAADTIYDMFIIDAGWSKNSIKYLSPETFQDNYRVTDYASRDNFASAIMSWGSDADLLIISFMDHGGHDTIFLNPSQTNGYVTAHELANWVNSYLQADPAHKIIVIIDACYSGSFIDDFASVLPYDGRWSLLAASQGDEVSYNRNASFGTWWIEPDLYSFSFIKGTSLNDPLLVAPLLEPDSLEYPSDYYPGNCYDPFYKVNWYCSKRTRMNDIVNLTCDGITYMEGVDFSLDCKDASLGMDWASCLTWMQNRPQTNSFCQLNGHRKMEYSISPVSTFLFYIWNGLIKQNLLLGDAYVSARDYAHQFVSVNQNPRLEATGDMLDEELEDIQAANNNFMLPLKSYILGPTAWVSPNYYLNQYTVSWDPN
ncbi:MAG: hypothetical protein HY758_01110, partial [Nitrospirae bacterium]|nr:hypothetical protein [Nitrospirota bacterium]